MLKRVRRCRASLLLASHACQGRLALTAAERDPAIAMRSRRRSAGARRDDSARRSSLPHGRRWPPRGTRIGRVGKAVRAERSRSFSCCGACVGAERRAGSNGARHAAGVFAGPDQRHRRAIARRGWICAAKHAGDRRRHHWQLSATGRELLEQMLQHARCAHLRLTSRPPRMPPESRQTDPRTGGRRMSTKSCIMTDGRCRRTAAIGRRC